MTTFSNPPGSSKGGVVLLGPETAELRRIISLQYNPDTLTRTLQPQSFKEGSDRSEVFGLSGRPIETIMEVEVAK
jgi:hypothetical protein